jgi:hypothetical protein
MDQIEQEIFDDLTMFATSLSVPGDITWKPDVDELLRLYIIRDQHENSFWMTPVGSPERAEWDEYNVPYIAALNLWEKTWKIIVGHHDNGKYITYEVAADALKLQGMEF